MKVIKKPLAHSRCDSDRYRVNLKKRVHPIAKSFETAIHKILIKIPGFRNNSTCRYNYVMFAMVHDSVINSSLKILMVCIAITS